MILFHFFTLFLIHFSPVGDLMPMIHLRIVIIFLSMIHFGKLDVFFILIQRTAPKDKQGE